jgi:hypothetical protein
MHRPQKFADDAALSSLDLPARRRPPHPSPEPNSPDLGQKVHRHELIAPSGLRRRPLTLTAREREEG